MTALEIRLEALERKVSEQQAEIAGLRLAAEPELSPMTMIQIRELAQQIHKQGPQRGPYARRNRQ